MTEAQKQLQTIITELTSKGHLAMIKCLGGRNFNVIVNGEVLTYRKTRKACRSLLKEYHTQIMAGQPFKPKNRANTLSESAKNLLIAKIYSGEKIMCISTDMGVSMGTVAYYMRKENIIRQPNKQAMSTIDKILEEAGMTALEMIKEKGIELSKFDDKIELSVDPRTQMPSGKYHVSEHYSTRSDSEDEAKAKYLLLMDYIKNKHTNENPHIQ